MRERGSTLPVSPAPGAANGGGAERLATGARARLRRTASRAVERSWGVVGAVSVRTKIMGIVLGLVVLLGVGMTAQVRATMARTLGRELQERGVSIARDLAARSTKLVLTNDLFALHQLLHDTVDNNEDLRYAFILDAMGQVLVHSFDQGVPPDLLTVNRGQAGDRSRLQILATKEGMIHDVAVPIFEGQAGTARVGLSEHRLKAQMAATTRQLLLITLVVSMVGVLGGFLLTRVLTRPVKTLVEATQALAAGDLSHRAPHWANDEIGALGTAFNAMVDDLARGEQERAAYNTELERRNRDLAALNAVAEAVSGSLDLDQVLERALGKVFEVTGLKAGWIRMVTEDGQYSELVCYAGLTDEIAQREAARDPELCACIELLGAKVPVVIGPLAETCPLLDVDLGEGKRVACHAAVPIVAKSQVLAVLNVAGHDADQFTSEDLEMLDAIGRQIGVAIENASLLKELRRKEELRGQLLKKLIMAQEEERRRIALELHDETSQSMASLVVGLKAAQASLSINPVRSGEILSGLRGSVSQTVKELHNIVYDLRPTLLDDLGLIPALRWYAETRLTAHGVEVELEVEGQPRRLPPEAEITLFRIAQEAVTNIVRHAGASQVRLALRFGDEAAAVDVRDNGRGFDVRDTLDTDNGRQGLGLLGIQERAALLGGTFDVRSEPGEGTDLLVWVPVSLQVGDDGQDTDSTGR